MQFSAGKFAGKITRFHNDTATCLVVFADGDKGEYDAKEIRAGKKLYDMECNSKNCKGYES